VTLATIWQVLGIDPTDDLRTIRRAYAALLKTIDMESEPQRFIALREAYEAALSGIRETPLPFAIEEAAPIADLSELVPVAMDGADRAAIQRIAGRIRHLLQGGEPIAAIEDELTDLTLRMTAEIDRDTIDRQADAEEWIVATITAHLPRSDAMVHPAVAAFRWQARRYGQYRPDKAMIVIDRMRELNFAQLQVLHEGGRHHLAWRTLQHPPRRGLLRRPDFAGLAALGSFFREVGNVPRVATVTFDMVIVAQWHAQLRRYDLAIGRWKNSQYGGWKQKVAEAVWLLMILAFFGMVITGILVSYLR
jgi:hypothetical protein